MSIFWEYNMPSNVIHRHTLTRETTSQNSMLQPFSSWGLIWSICTQESKHMYQGLNFTAYPTPLKYIFFAGNPLIESKKLKKLISKVCYKESNHITGSLSASQKICPRKVPQYHGFPVFFSLKDIFRCRCNQPIKEAIMIDISIIISSQTEMRLISLVKGYYR